MSERASCKEWQMPRFFSLWTDERWCDHELEVEPAFLPALRSLLPADWAGDGQTFDITAVLVPEPNGSRGQSAISVRVDGHTIGYLGAEVAPRWAGVVRRVVASGFLPTTKGRVWASEYDNWDGIEFHATAQISLGDPESALPFNIPPTEPYTMLPRSSIVQVTREDEHYDALLKHVPKSGRGVLFVTLRELGREGRKSLVGVRINNEQIGQLTPQTSQKFLPMIKHLRDRGLLTVCWADIRGSKVAAEVRICAIKASEATPELLDGDPRTVPALVPERADPLSYDLSAMQKELAPLPTKGTATRPFAVEPIDGSVVRFDKGGGRYNYVAVRRGDQWVTTATDDWGSVNEVMTWRDLAPKVRQFRIVTAWAPITPGYDERVVQHLAVVRFTITGLYLAAINICETGDYSGNWYTTVTNRAEEYLPFGDNVDWSQIATHGKYIQVATSWVDLR